MDKKAVVSNAVTEWDFGAYKVASFDIHQENGAVAQFNVLKCPDWVNIIAVLGSGEIVLVRQFRHALGRETLELPGGIVDDGKTPFQAAQDELLDEAGFFGGEWIQLGCYLANPGLQNNYVHTFLCRNPSFKEGSEQEDGVMVRLMSPRDFIVGLHHGELSQSFMLASVFMAINQGFIQFQSK